MQSHESANPVGFLRLLIILSILTAVVPGIASSQPCNCRALNCQPCCNQCCDNSTSLGRWWCGEQSDYRKSLTSQGITIDNNLTQFYYGVTSGGLEQEFSYSGHGDYLVNLDVNKLGGPQGQFVKIRAEHRFGESLSGNTGALLPPMVLADLPTTATEDLYITNLLFTQALSESFAVFAGKLDTLDGDANAFAHGRGRSQFSNTAFVATPIGLRTIAYSTLGTGFVVLDKGQPIVTFTVLNARDTTRTIGVNELFNDGVVLSPEVRLPTNFLGLPGHQLFGGTWSSRNYAALDQDPRIFLPNVPIARQSDSWSLYWNFDQYLYVDPCDPKRGWGLFGRAGIADAATNPVRWFASYGAGGSSLLQGRSADTFGIGWYYLGLSNEITPFIANVLGGLGDTQGGEVFYNISVTPRFNVTIDGQVLLPGLDTADTALIAGVRANLKF